MSVKINEEAIGKAVLKESRMRKVIMFILWIEM